jgi:hypothetical protein
MAKCPEKNSTRLYFGALAFFMVGTIRLAVFYPGISTPK